MQLSVVCPKIWGDGEIGHPQEIDQEGPLSRNFGIYVPPQGQEFDLAVILEGWVKLEIEVICHLRSYPTKFVYWNWYTISLDPGNGISIYNGYLWVKKWFWKLENVNSPPPPHPEANHQQVHTVEPHNLHSLGLDQIVLIIKWPDNQEYEY